MAVMPTDRLLRWFRYSGLVEGASFLVLLFIAMPLKYFFDAPGMVRFVGWAHGVLFVNYGLLALWVAHRLRWSFRRLFTAGIAALLPFGPFVFDKSLQREMRYRSIPS